MNKEEYLAMIASQPNKLLYYHYTENFDSSIHSPFLSENEFFHFIGLFCGPQLLFNELVKKYNEKFGVSELKDANGNLIKLL
jgi:hypothetical protein